MSACAALAGCGEDAPPLERARGVVEDDGRFDTAAEAGGSFARVAELLLGEHNETSAWMQIVAVDVLRCRQHQIHDTRRTVLEHLEKLDRGEATRLPPLPACS